MVRFRSVVLCFAFVSDASQSPNGPYRPEYRWNFHPCACALRREGTRYDIKGPLFFAKVIIPSFNSNRFRVNEGATSSGLIVTLPSKASKSSPILTGADLNAFLAEMTRSLEAKKADLKKVFPSDKGIVSVPEAMIVTMCLLVKDISQHYVDGMNYIEDMLRQVFFFSSTRSSFSV